MKPLPDFHCGALYCLPITFSNKVLAELFSKSDRIPSKRIWHGDRKNALRRIAIIPVAKFLRSFFPKATAPLSSDFGAAVVRTLCVV